MRMYVMVHARVCEHLFKLLLHGVRLIGTRIRIQVIDRNGMLRHTFRCSNIRSIIKMLVVEILDKQCLLILIYSCVNWGINSIYKRQRICRL